MSALLLLAFMNAFERPHPLSTRASRIMMRGKRLLVVDSLLCVKSIQNLLPKIWCALPGPATLTPPHFACLKLMRCDIFVEIALAYAEMFSVRCAADTKAFRALPRTNANIANRRMSKKCIAASVRRWEWESEIKIVLKRNQRWFWLRCMNLRLSWLREESVLVSKTQFDCARLA